MEPWWWEDVRAALALEEDGKPERNRCATWREEGVYRTLLGRI